MKNKKIILSCIIVVIAAVCVGIGSLAGYSYWLDEQSRTKITTTEPTTTELVLTTTTTSTTAYISSAEIDMTDAQYRAVLNVLEKNGCKIGGYIIRDANSGNKSEMFVQCTLGGKTLCFVFDSTGKAFVSSQMNDRHQFYLKYNSLDNEVYLFSSHSTQERQFNEIMKWSSNSWYTFAALNGRDAFETIEEAYWGSESVSEQIFWEKANLYGKVSELKSENLYKISLDFDKKITPDAIINTAEEKLTTYSGYQCSARGDVDGDGVKEFVCVLRGASQKWWGNITALDSYVPKSVLAFKDTANTAVVGDYSDGKLMLYTVELGTLDYDFVGAEIDLQRVTLIASDGRGVVLNANPSANSKAEPYLSVKSVGTPTKASASTATVR